MDTTRDAMGTRRQDQQATGRAGPASLTLRDGRRCDALVFGHTHKPYARTIGGVLFVNAGSVGAHRHGINGGDVATSMVIEEIRARSR